MKAISVNKRTLNLELDIKKLLFDAHKRRVRN